MHQLTLGRLALYFVVQGGKFDAANTIYFWPALSLAQEQKGFEFGRPGTKYHWILAVSFLFWTIGAMW